MAVRKRQHKALSKSAMPAFSFSWLAPKYWFTWLGILLLSAYQFLPIALRHGLARRIGRYLYNKNHKRRNIALTNLSLCFPQWSEQQKEQLVMDHFIANIQVMSDLPLLWWSGKNKLQKRIVVENFAETEKYLNNQQNLILLTCHNIALEYGAIGLNFKMPVIGLVNPFRNALVDWLISRARTRFNIKLGVRKDGIRPIISAIKKGDVFYYLPDEDALDQRTIEAPFFNQPKQTLPTLARLAKLSQAQIIPCYSFYDFEQKKYRVKLFPRLELQDSGDEQLSTCQMNEALQTIIMSKPEQYMWTMRLFESYKVYG